MIKRLLSVCCTVTVIILGTVQCDTRQDVDMTVEQSMQAEQDARMHWWREARFGMFIHWGLYAIPAGEWKGQHIKGIGEWIMNRAKIPVLEYEQLATQFNPVKFDAKEWVRLAKAAGMKYITITSKHHDGFAMFDSPSHPYNIVDATPFGRDPIKELADACRDAGLRLCFYYSQTQDWHEPDAAGNTWDFPDEAQKDFEKYLREKVEPQVREILTQYGPIGMIWFDTPRQMTSEQSMRLLQLVRSLQPDCIVNGRIGNEVGDYVSMGDNQIPPGRVPGDWETPATMNDTWAFKTADHNWKSTTVLLRLLVDIVSKGGNYLLNVGPTAEGVIPAPSVERLEEIGQWMGTNSEAIYGTTANPYPYEFPWGRITQKPGTMYLMMYDWPAEPFTLYGLKSTVTKAYLLADRDRDIPISQQYEQALDHHVLHLELPAQPPDPRVSVVVLELEGSASVEELPLQQPDGTVTMLAGMAELQRAAGDTRMRIGNNGVVENWYDSASSMYWDFKVLQPGEYQVKIITAARRTWQGGHTVRISVADQDLRGAITADEKISGVRTQYKPEAATYLGTVTLSRTGMYRLQLAAEEIRRDVPDGLTVASVQLVPVEK